MVFPYPSSLSMNQKTIVSLVIALLVVGAGAFYGGTVYAGKKAPSAAARAMDANRVAGGRAGAGGFGQGQGGAATRGGAGMNGGFTAGEVISKNANSITLKLQDGGSKVVLYATSTPVMKTTEGSMNDVAAGTQVTITGTANSDGSIMASSVQIRPAGSPLMMMGGRMATGTREQR